MTREAVPPAECEVIILTALPIEYQAIRCHLQELKEVLHPSGTIYSWGTIPGKQRPWCVAVAQVGQGGTQAAIEAEKALSFFRAQMALFVGIAGGRKDVRLGDVVVATKIYAYEAGKDGSTFEPRPELWRPSHALEQRARHEALEETWLLRLGSERLPSAPHVHLGPLAAGAEVITSTHGKTAAQLGATYGDTLAVEMEGHGFLQAVHLHHAVHGLVIRGIANLLDNKSAADVAGWQKVAAEHAAAFAFQVLATFTLPLFDGFAMQASIWNLPFARNPFFTGRDEVLKLLHTQLQTTQAAAVSQSRAISGLGGIGKTQLATEYAYRYRQEYQNVLWARADTTEALNASYTEIAGLLHLPGHDAQEQEVIVQAVKHWLRTKRGWLLVLDNADELDLVQPFLPTEYPGHLLLTTRSQITGKVAQRFEMETLEVEMGALLLLRRAGLLALDALWESASLLDRTNACTLSEELGGLPLALDQAGAYIEEAQCSLADYHQLYQERGAELLARRGMLARDYPESVATTWSLSFEQVRLQNPAAADLLRLCAFLAADVIPEELLSKGAKELGDVLAPVAVDAYQLDLAIGTLRAYSLISRDPRTHTLIVHRLVQAVLKDALNREEYEVWRKRATRMVAASLPIISFSNWMRCEQWLPHAQVCAMPEEDDHRWIRETASIAHWTGSYLVERYRLREAEPYLQQALNWKEEHQPSGDKAYMNSMASTLDRFALLRLRQGKYAEAEPMYERALNLSLLVLGLYHPDTATSLTNLANLDLDQGKYIDAEPLFKQALDIYERLGVNDSNMATSLDRLACAYMGQGRYADAEPLFKQSLAISEEQLGTSHPHTTNTLSNLAILYLKQEKYREAKPLLQRALANNEEQLGANHPSTADNLHSLAGFYEQQGRYAEAEPLYQRALTIAEQQLGHEHPTTGLYLAHLGDCYRELGRYAEAEPLYVRVLSIREQQPGPQHPDTATSLNNLAYLYHLQGRYAEAEPLYQRALTIVEQQLGIDHPTKGLYLNNLAHLYQHQGGYVKAELLYQQALAIAEQCWGTEHLTTGMYQEDLAELYQQQGRYAEAEPLYKRALAIYEHVLDREHPRNKGAREHYASLLHTMGREAKATIPSQDSTQSHHRREITRKKTKGKMTKKSRKNNRNR